MLVIFLHEIRHVIFKSVVENTFADLVADVNHKMFIVDAGKSFACNFVDFIEVVKVSGCVIFTTVAVASGVEWFEHFAVFGIANVDAAVWSVESTVTGLASRGDAIKRVAAILGANEQVSRFGAHAEKMTWFVLRENFVGKFDDVGGIFGFGGVE